MYEHVIQFVGCFRRVPGSHGLHKSLHVSRPLLHAKLYITQQFTLRLQGVYVNLSARGMLARRHLS